jgi:hypothetical protein
MVLAVAPFWAELPSMPLVLAETGTQSFGGVPGPGFPLSQQRAGAADERKR